MLISPSLMCAKFANLKETLEAFENGKIEYLHIDIMDGSFVPNIGLGTDYCNQLRDLTDIPLDIHLMVYEPEKKMEYFKFGKGDIVSVHAESTPHIRRALSQIKEKGAKAFVAINPGTPINLLDEIYDIIDGVLVMTVNPGFSGQKMIPNAIEKITRVKAKLTELNANNVIIEVDGNVGFENGALMKAAGAQMFVGGTSSIFHPENSIENNILKFRKI